ncbi:MAG TPA: hypothetical protein VFU65_21755 [Actinocrinis sp.]|nr:hypothetical protein [Actinocrinis sp.]
MIGCHKACNFRIGDPCGNADGLLRMHVKYTSWPRALVLCHCAAPPAPALLRAVVYFGETLALYAA